MRFRSENAVFKFLWRGVDMYQSKLILLRDYAEPLIPRSLCNKEWRFEVQDSLSDSRVYPQTVLVGLCSKSLTRPIFGI